MTYITTQDNTFPTSATRYYSNCRGLNLVLPLEEEWKKSGYLPRYPLGLSVLGLLQPDKAFTPSDSFVGANKASMWWYYNRTDAEKSLQILKGHGINSVRIFGDYYVWLRDPDKYLTNLKDFMDLCDKYSIRVMFTIWDGVNVYGIVEAFVPTNYTQALTGGLELGLAASWHENPFSFAVATQASATEFLTGEGRGLEYVSSVVAAVSSFQSIFAFDILNEGVDEYYPLISGTSPYLSSLVSALDIQITFGYGDGFKPYSAAAEVDLGTGLGTGPGGSFGGYPNTLFQYSASMSIASPHFYDNGIRYPTVRYMEDAISGSLMIGKPVMFNEARQAANNFETFSSYGFGGLTFHALIDRPYSLQPFKDVQGVFFLDGDSRLSSLTDFYIRQSRDTNWFSDRQLNIKFTTKSDSANNGSDRGYVTGVAKEHLQFNPTQAVSTTEDKWLAAKTLWYSVTPSDAATNFTKLAGDPNAISTAYTVYRDVENIETYLSALYNYNEYFPPLSSWGDSDWTAKNESIIKRTLMLSELSLYPLEINSGSPWSELRGSDWDINPIPLSDRYAFSAAFSGFQPETARGFSLNASTSILPAANSRFATLEDMVCITNNTCIYNTPGDEESGIDWEAYDVIYQDCVDKLKTCLNYFLESTDPKLRLY